MMNCRISVEILLQQSVSHLTAGSEVSSVELIRDVPSKRTKLLPLLNTFDIA